MKTKHWKIAVAVTVALIMTGTGILLAASKAHAVVHVVTVKWKDGATPEQIQKALDGVEKLAADYTGIRNVWTRSIKVQGTEADVTHAFVMEFASEQALKDYSGSDAQKRWYRVYLPIRDHSRTFDITN